MSEEEDTRTARLFTLEEANEMVPWLQEKLNRLQRRHGDVQTRLARWMARRGLPPEARTTDLLREAMKEDAVIEALVRQIEAGVATIEQRGCVFQGVEMGLVDFPCEMDGEVVFLCWQAGESEIGFWHPLDGGFRGRRPLYDSDPTKVIN